MKKHIKKYIKKPFNFVSKRNKQVKKLLGDIKKSQADQVIVKGKRRVPATIVHSVYYFGDKLTDFIIPMLAVPAIVGIALNPTFLVIGAAGLGAFTVALTINEAFKYWQGLKQARQEHQTSMKVQNELDDINVKISQAYEDIDRLKDQLSQYPSDEADNIDDANNPEQAASEPSEPVVSMDVAHGRLDKILNKIHKTMMKAMHLIKEVKEQIHSVLEVKHVVQKLKKVLGLIKLLCLSVLLLPALPIIGLVVGIKVLVLNAVAEERKNISAVRSNQPELVSASKDLLALAQKEVEVLKLKLQLRERESLFTQKPLVFAGGYGKHTTKLDDVRQGSKPKGGVFVDADRYSSAYSSVYSVA